MTLDEIRTAIAAMTPAERSRIRAVLERFAEADADAWDRQIERDAKSGKLDKLFAESKEDFRAGRYREI